MAYWVPHGHLVPHLVDLLGASLCGCILWVYFVDVLSGFTLWVYWWVCSVAGDASYWMGCLLHLAGWRADLVIELCCIVGAEVQQRLRGRIERQYNGSARQ